ncbi:MocR-like pyridoxine biosynthesis transcription factor PdxR [Parasphingorhabdus pacifica]
MTRGRPNLESVPGLGRSDKPDSRTLAESLRTAIRNGRLPAGSRMPSTRALAEDLGIARGTVTRAYDQLTTEGFLLSRQGSPTTVAERLATTTPADHATPVQDGPADHAGLEHTGPAERRGHPGAGTETGAGGGEHDEEAAAHDGTTPRWDFRPGRPDLHSFPRKEWLAAGRRALNKATVGDLDYGDPQGHPALRTALADYLGRVRAVVADPGRIVVCNGYGEAFSLLTKALRTLGIRAVDFEDPSRPQFRSTAHDAGLTVRGVPVDDHGIDVSALTNPVAAVTPAHQYPLGVTMGSARRTALVQRAKSADRIVVEDDYDGEFRYDRQPVGALQGMAPEHVVYAGTTSKTLAPALRIAWLVLPARLVAPVRALKTRSGVHAPLFEQLTLAELISTGAYDQHVRRCRTTYRQRRASLLDAVTATPHRPYPAGISAGLHVALRLDPHGPTEHDILARARERSVALDRLATHWVGPGPHPGGVVIGYAAPDGRTFRSALRTLVEVLDAR